MPQSNVWAPSLVALTASRGLVALGHAGESTFLTQEEQVDVIKAFVRSVDERIPIITGITTEGTEVAPLEAQRSNTAGVLFDQSGDNINISFSTG